VVRNNEKILLVTVETNLRLLLHRRLVKLGYQLLIALDGYEAISRATSELPSLIIIDIILPKFDGFEVCHRIRKNSKAPIILLSPFVSVSDLLMYLDLGVDGYITKPFSPKELETRIRSVMQRCYSENDSFVLKSKQKRFCFGDLVIDWKTKEILKKSVKIKLTRIEYSLLELLINNAGKNLSRFEILTNVWGYIPERSIDMRVVDVYISRLRSKIEDDPGKPNLIITTRGTGYMFPEY